jgi:SnoaL-like domain
METLSQEAQYKLMRGWLNERQWPGGLAQEGLARSPARPESPEKRSAKAANRHDLEAMVACFAPDYRSEQPLYPERNFTGQAGVRKNWSFFFSTM